ncbi:hypothetical protein MKW92_043624 [Papaver armeniacum]|nr:hypothetical protein MKW92_043624 [Papaver armeniacum]
MSSFSSNENPNPNCKNPMISISSENSNKSSEDSVAKTTLSSSTKTTIDSFSWKSLGLNIKWLEQCLTYWNDSIPGFGNFSDSDKWKHINRFLLSDMKFSCGGGDGMLPKDIDGQHGIILHEDITYNPDDRLVGVPPGFNRILMLSMTDGVQCVFGFEDRPIKDLQVREGFLVLELGHLKVLVVEHLEAQRQKSEKYLGMQDWIKAIPTPDAWKPNGIGGFFIEENSTWHDGVSSRSDIQDPSVENMDAIPSFQSKIEEDSVVPKNGDPELEEKQSASLEQLNAIIKAAGTTCAAADTTCETVLHQIKKIWDEVGQYNLMPCMADAMHGECHGILLQIQHECFNVYQKKFDQEKKSKDNLVKEMDLKKEELTRLASSAVMEKQFSDILIEVERLQWLKDVREEKFADVQSKIQEILEELPEEAKVPTVVAEDLSWKSLEASDSSRVKFPNNKRILEMAESVVCDIRNQRRKGLKKDKEMTRIETDPEAARRKITSLFDNSEEMLVQVKNWMSACKLYSWLEDYNREENSYSSSSSRGEDLNLYRVIEIPAKTLALKWHLSQQTTRSKCACPTHLPGKG